MNIETIFASLHFVVHLALLSFEFAISTYSIFGCDCEHSPRKVEVGFLIQFLKKNFNIPIPMGWSYRLQLLKQDHDSGQQQQQDGTQYRSQL
jgi:hypothetical protein